LNFLSREGREGGEVRRTGIFVDSQFQNHQSSVRSDIIGICRPDGAEIMFGLWFYKYAAPTALKTESEHSARGWAMTEIKWGRTPCRVEATRRVGTQ